MSRCFVAPQAGRAVRGGSVPADDEPWGTTSSKSQFRAYEPVEAKNCRSTPAQVRTCLEQTGPLSLNRAASGTGGFRRGGGTSRAYSSASRDAASAVTDMTASSYKNCQGNQPAWLEKGKRPISPRRFLANSTYREHQAEAQEARHGYFPYRDEFAPRSKRLLYEMALAKCLEEDEKSAIGSTAESASCFTVASKARSRASMGMGRSSSSPALPPVSERGPPTADSQRIPGGPGALARRRREAQLRAPTLCPADEKWFRETLEKEGPAGLTTINYPAAHHNGSHGSHGEKIIGNNAMIGWSKEVGIGNIGQGLE
mmetsp:Transcript_6413/g.15885  ORF Transcript_6413/g.15885 Transcript_6413/m.15885 type:complete len:314 (-) Transcript_6413:237-1178(-)